MRHGAIEMALVKTKPGEDAMAGYDYSHHHSPDSAYVPGFGEKNHQSTSGSSSSSAPASSKRDSLSNLWHLYAKNHSAEPYTEYHKAHNANIFNHVKEHYGVEVAKAMHGHAEALRQGHIYSIRKKYNISESLSIPDKLEIHGKAAEMYRRHMIDTLDRAKKDTNFTDIQSHPLYREYQYHAGQYTHHINKYQEALKQATGRRPVNEDLENKDKPKSTKELARKYIARFRDQKVRNRKRLKKISKIYESTLDAQGEQKFNELKEHPYVKSHFIGDWYKTSYGDNHHAFQTREHTSLKNGSKHELRAAVRPNGDHEVTLLSHHKTKNEFASGRGVGKSWDEAINKARAEHTKSLDLAAGGIKAHPRAHVKVRKEMDDLEH